MQTLHALLSRRWARMKRRASSPAVHANMNAGKVSAESHHPCLQWRRGGGWYLFFDRINRSRGEILNHARRTMGLDKLVESKNKHRDYLFTTLFIGHT